MLTIHSITRNSVSYKFFIFVALEFLPIQVAFGQSKNPYAISGIVMDSVSKKSIELASVSVYRLADNSLITGTITNAKGQFTINNLNQGEFLLKSSFVGYKSHTTKIEILDASVTLDPILLSSSSLILKEIQVTGKQSEKQVTIEKTKINVAQNLSAVTGNLTEVLKSMSSITIDAENNIYLRESRNILILVDGKPTTVASLNSIPASGVESVEIITNPDAKYDAEGTGGIINVVMKRQGSSGMSAMATLNVGINNRVNGGLNLNLRKGIWDVGLNYNGKFEKAGITSSLDRQIFSSGVFIAQDIRSTQLTPTHAAAMNITARPSPKTSISLGVKTMFVDLFNTQIISGTLVHETFPETSFNRRNEITFSRRVIESTLSYKRVLQKNKQEISADASLSRTHGSRPAEYFIDDRLLQKSFGGGAPTNITVQVDHYKTLFRSGKIESGLKAFSRSNSFNYDFYDLDTITAYWIRNSSFSNDLEHKEFIYSAYAMYSDSLFKKLFYKVGARFEYHTSELIQRSINETIAADYLFPFPYLLIKRNISKAQSIAFTINRRVTRPTYPQLNPFINVIDQMTYETGNRNLVSEMLDKAELNHTWIKEKFQTRTNLYYSTTKNFITQVTLPSSSSELFITYINGGRLNKVGADLDATVKIKRVFILNPGFSVFYARSTGTYNSIDLSLNNLAWTGNLKATYKPDQKTDIQIFLNYNSPVALPQFNLSEIYYADIAIKRSFLKNRVILSLSLTDMFNTRKWILHSDNAVFNLNNSSKSDTRVLWFGLTYNINSFKSMNGQKLEGGETDSELIKLGN
ncbi:MAG TPA: hypothetical protein DC042_07975 [Bacteroidales bacterium]|nr:hypothetical protein [Bacteroidales bacterium]